MISFPVENGKTFSPVLGRQVKITPPMQRLLNALTVHGDVDTIRDGGVVTTVVALMDRGILREATPRSHGKGSGHHYPATTPEQVWVEAHLEHNARGVDASMRIAQDVRDGNYSIVMGEPVVTPGQAHQRAVREAAEAYNRGDIDDDGNWREPCFPKGTPEYAAYEAELKTELGKWAAGETPYGYPAKVEQEPCIKVGDLVQRIGEQGPDAPTGKVLEVRDWPIVGTLVKVTFEGTAATQKQAGELVKIDAAPAWSNFAIRTPEPLVTITDRYDLSEVTCPACGEVVKVAWPDELRPHSTPLGESCIGDRHSRCGSRMYGLRCQLAPHEDGRHVRRPTRHSGLSAWNDDEVKPVTPVAETTPSLAGDVAALRAEIHAVASGLVLGVLPTERDMLARLDRIAARVPQRATDRFGQALWVHTGCGCVRSWSDDDLPKGGLWCADEDGQVTDWRALYTVPGR